MNGKAMACAMAGFFFSTVGCSAAETTADKVTADSGKVLIAYYSWGGNTGKIATAIQKQTGGTLFAIKPAQAYPADYKACVNQAKKECREGFHPELASKIDLAKYEVIFVGSPNWWGTMAPPVATFLTTGDFKDKTVIPFFTNGGGGMQNCERNVRKLCPGVKILKAATFSGSSTEGLDAWLKGVIEIRMAEKKQ